MAVLQVVEAELKRAQAEVERQKALRADMVLHFCLTESVSTKVNFRTNPSSYTYGNG